MAHKLIETTGLSVIRYMDFVKEEQEILYSDHYNYSSRIVFSRIPIEFGQKVISAIRSADPENPILEPNTK